ncbi:alginate O-acetyltransferase AlgF [Shewanella sp. JM162201]|uniref:Alginate biosynthesis protein AlgF n=1 Tax=Shewanella jiangmenensis TaxID=2837387 RepID=A0ABS5V5X4_9GAMM|nr:alginate O-acetyltransferase AlgF [Shewanella jiangmenensis]MBT1445099.1 alginate O-acetyltransferase AlgF [Shewanella jiangmenensis]
MYMRSFVLFVCVLLGAMAQAWAQGGNAELYDAAVPADSGFVRVLNASRQPVMVTLSGKRQPQRVAAMQFGGYRYTQPGHYRLEVEGASIELDIRANMATTVLYHQGQLQGLDDQLVLDLKRAQLNFYNLAMSALSLKTSGGKSEVIAAVAPKTNGHRMVNELKMGFEAFDGDAAVGQFEAQLLRKGRSYSFAVIEDEQGKNSISHVSFVDKAE